MVATTVHDDAVSKKEALFPGTVHVDVVSAEEALFSGLATMVVVPGEMGELGIYARHTPLMTRRKPNRQKGLPRSVPFGKYANNSAMKLLRLIQGGRLFSPLRKYPGVLYRQ